MGKQRAVSAVLVLVLTSACGSPSDFESGAADIVGEALMVEIAFDVPGRHATLGRITVRDIGLGCNVTVRLSGTTRLRDREGPISLIEVAPGQVVQVWTLEATDCSEVTDAREVLASGRARSRTPAGST